jgi:hypothetical protein
MVRKEVFVRTKSSLLGRYSLGKTDEGKEIRETSGVLVVIRTWDLQNRSL